MEHRVEQDSVADGLEIVVEAPAVVESEAELARIHHILPEVILTLVPDKRPLLKSLVLAAGEVNRLGIYRFLLLGGIYSRVSFVNAAEVDPVESALLVLCTLCNKVSEGVVRDVVFVSLRVSRERNKREVRHGIADVVRCARLILNLTGCRAVCPLGVHAQEQNAVGVISPELRRYPVAYFVLIGQTVSVEVCAVFHRAGYVDIADVVPGGAVLLYLYKRCASRCDEAHRALACIADVAVVSAAPVDKELLKCIPCPLIVHVEVVGIVKRVFLKGLAVVVQREVGGYAVGIIIVLALVRKALSGLGHVRPQRGGHVDLAVERLVHILAHARRE